MRIEQIINFSGFYDSRYKANIESDIELYFNGDFEKINNLNIDYKKLYGEYSKALINEFNKFIIEEYEININIEFVELLSPRFYNYSTDQLSVSCDNRLSKLYIKLIKNDRFIEYIKELTNIRDGYIPFYNISDFKKSFYKWDDIQKSVLLDFTMSEFENIFWLEFLDFDIYSIENWFHS